MCRGLQWTSQALGLPCRCQSIAAAGPSSALFITVYVSNSTAKVSYLIATQDGARRARVAP